MTTADVGLEAAVAALADEWESKAADCRRTGHDQIANRWQRGARELRAVLPAHAAVPRDDGLAVRLTDAEAGEIHDARQQPYDGPLFAAVEAILAARLAAVPRDWPCDDYKPPLTCWTTPKPKTMICGGCRDAFPDGPKVQRILTAVPRASDSARDPGLAAAVKALEPFRALAEEMVDRNRMTGTMPGVRLQEGRRWATRLRALTDPGTDA